MSSVRTLRSQVAALAFYSRPVRGLVIEDGTLITIDEQALVILRRPYDNEGPYTQVFSYTQFSSSATCLERCATNQELYVGTAGGTLHVFSTEHGLDSPVHVRQLVVCSAPLLSLQWLGIARVMFIATGSSNIAIYVPLLKKIFLRRVTKKPILCAFVDEMSETLYVTDKKDYVRVYKLLLENDELNQRHAVIRGSNDYAAGRITYRDMWTALESRGSTRQSSREAAAAEVKVDPPDKDEYDSLYEPRPLTILGTDSKGKLSQSAHTRAIRTFLVDSTDGLLFTAGMDRIVAVWGTEDMLTSGTSYIIDSININHTRPTALAFSSTRLILFTADEVGMISTIDVNSMIVINAWVAHHGPINGLYLDDARGLLYSYGKDCLLKIWRVWIAEDECRGYA